MKRARRPSSPRPSRGISPSDSFDIDSETATLIRRKAHRLARQAGFTRSDQPDLEQELALQVLQRRRRFDSAQGSWSSFVHTVIERRSANLLRDRRAGKRDPRRCTSLNARNRSRHSGTNELAQSISVDQRDAQLGRRSRDDVELAELRYDVAEAVAGLPTHQRELAGRLGRQPLAQAAREMGVPRSTAQGWRRRILRRFEELGLCGYLESQSSPGARTG